MPFLKKWHLVLTLHPNHYFGKLSGLCPPTKMYLSFNSLLRVSELLQILFLTRPNVKCERLLPIHFNITNRSELVPDLKTIITCLPVYFLIGILVNYQQRLCFLMINNNMLSIVVYVHHFLPDTVFSVIANQTTWSMLCFPRLTKFLLYAY